MLRRVMFPLALASQLVAPHASALTITDEMNEAPSRGNGGIFNAYPWTSVVFGGTGMTADSGVLTLQTGPGLGVWFGNGGLIGYTPGWSLANNADGNYLNVSLKLGPHTAQGPEDWNLYFYDGSGYEASMSLNPGTAAGYVDGDTQYGFSIFHADANGAGVSDFVPFDFSDAFHTVEVLMKGGLVQYRVDGHAYFTGAAYLAGPADLLVIGDGSGSTPTGTGTMLIDRVVFEAGTARVAAVPLPAGAFLFLGGLAGLGATTRRGRRI